MERGRVVGAAADNLDAGQYVRRSFCIAGRLTVDPTRTVRADRLAVRLAISRAGLDLYPHTAAQHVHVNHDGGRRRFFFIALSRPSRRLCFRPVCESMICSRSITRQRAWSSPWSCSARYWSCVRGRQPNRHPVPAGSRAEDGAADWRRRQRERGAACAGHGRGQIRHRPGEAVPVDGIVTEGRSLVDEAMLTGEPTPIAKAIGSPLTGGTINGTGSMVMEEQYVMFTVLFLVRWRIAKTNSCCREARSSFVH